MAKEKTKLKPPSQTIEGREEQLINLAEMNAEKRLRDGTASNALILHYLNAGSTKTRLEKKRIEKDIELAEAKTKNIGAAENLEAMFTEAMDLFKQYSGETNEVIAEDEDL